MNPEALLSAMITPAVLISASGTLILSTSNRLGRAADRVRALSGRYRELGREEADLDEPFAPEERTHIARQLPVLMRRVRVLQRALTAFYASVGLFVLTSVVIGSASLTGLSIGIVPIVLGVVGTGVLSYGALLLLIESRLALDTTYAEMTFLTSVSERLAPGIKTDDGRSR